VSAGLRFVHSWAIIGTMNATSMNWARLALALALAASAMASAHAGSDRWYQDAQEPHAFSAYRVAQQRVTLQQAIDIVQQATGGRVLDAKEGNGQYRIKVLTRNGEVRVVYVDAQTGEMH
jgi:uncharacterized membrane protein YkoI